MQDRTRIKICGIRTPDIAIAAVDAGADMIGLNFVERSPRYVSVGEAKAVIEAVAKTVTTVGLFKNEQIERLQKVHEQTGFTEYQLHGAVSPALTSSLKPVHSWVSVPFDADRLDREIREWGRDAVGSGMAGLVVDAPDPTRLGGGTGKTFDWHALREVLDQAKPCLRIMLAGGLTPGNVSEAIRIVQPWAVDVSSGVESSRGVKDASLIRDFCRAASG